MLPCLHLLRTCTSPKTLSKIHTHLFISGLHKDILTSTKLIETYSQMGDLHSAQLVFNTYPNPDPFMWCVLIKSYVYSLFFKEAIQLYHQMICNYNQISSCNRYIIPSMLKACSGLSDVNMGRKFHGRVIKTGAESDQVVGTSLLCMYSEGGCLHDACNVFDEMPVRDVVSWSSMVLSQARNGRAFEGLGLFREMVFDGVKVDSVTMLSVTEACELLRDHRVAKSVHGYIVRRVMMMGGGRKEGSLESSLIVMYRTCGDMVYAERLFDKETCLNVASWTAMISCYNQSGRFKEALGVFVEMQGCSVELNSVTMVGVLVSCSELVCLRGGMSVHGVIIRRGVDLDLSTVGNALMEMYANCGKIRVCRKILYSVGERKIVLWNSLISVYERNGLFEESLRLFVQLRLQGLLPDSYTLASSLPSCGKISCYKLGIQIHSLIAKLGFDSNEIVQNSLIDMYSKCCFVDAAYSIFERMPEKSLVTWNTMIYGFAQNGNPVEAFSLLDEMHYKNLEMDKVTFLSAIQSCSQLGNLEKGIWFHHKLIVNGLENDSYIGTALIDMYAKCGHLPMAQRIFDRMSERSVVSWSAMIAGYGNHGCLENALSLFSEMVDLGIRPNEVTFISILSACSHAGSVDKGMSYFNLMRKEFGIEPRVEHYIFMVSLLSRTGDFTGAFDLIKSMSAPMSPSLWGALLNGCRIHGRLDMIESIQKTILDLEPNNSGYYTLLSNIYAEGGKWDEFHKTRIMMQDIGLRKVPGYSAVPTKKIWCGDFEQKMHPFF